MNRIVFMQVRRNPDSNNNFIGYDMRTKLFRIITPLLFLLLCSVQLEAQTKISGRVTDSTTKETLRSVSVKVVNTKQGTLTRADGTFTLMINDEQYLDFSYIGYKTKRVKVSGNKKNLKLDIALEVDTVQMSEVVVVAKSMAQQKREEPTAVSVVDMRKLEGRSLSLNDVLNRASGVKVLQKGGLGSSSRLFVQGLDGKGVGIFLNGVPMGSSEEFQVGSVPTDLIENVDVYKGIVPSELGGDGLSGAINIITKDFSTDHFEASYEIASLNTHRLSAVGKKIFEESGIGLDLNINYDYSDIDYEFNSPYVAMPEIVKCDNNTFRKFDANIGASFTKQWFDLMSFSFGYGNQYKDVQGGIVVIQTKIGDAHVKDRNYTATQTFVKNLFDDKLNINFVSMIDYSIENVVDTSFTRYNWDGTTEQRIIPGEWGNFPNNSDDKFWTVHEVMNVKYKLADAHFFNWNTSYKFNKKNPSDPLNDEYSAYSVNGYPSKLHALVSGLTYGLNLFDGNLKNELSGKFFYHYSSVLPTNEGVVTKELKTTENESSSFGWSEALVWKPFEELTLKASVSQAVRIPVSYEIFGDGVMIVPSTNINPEKSFNLNFGLNWLINQSDYPNFSIDVNVFRMNVEDMIRLFSTESMKMAYLNLDKAKISGIEGEVNAEFTPWLDAKINFSYQDSRDNNKEAVGGGSNWHYDYRIPNMPYCFGNAEIDLHQRNLLCKKSLSEIFLNLEYTHEFSYTWVANENSTLVIPERWNLDAGIRQSFADRYHISFEVHNLLDKEQWSEFRYPLPGRTYHLKLRYTLN